MGCNCRKRRMTQLTAANLAAQAAEAEQNGQSSSGAVEALVAGAAHTTTERDEPTGQTQSR